MNEYGVAWPLWGDPEGYEYQPGALAISPTLSADILAWAKNFNLKYSDETGWPSQQLAEAHFDEGHRIAAALQGELGSEFRVELGLWEILVTPPRE